MHVYASREFEQKANHYGLQKKVQKLCQDIESAEDIHKVQQEIFGTVHQYLRFNAGRYRLIGSTRRVGDEQIVVLLDIFDKGKKYDDFSNEVRHKGKSENLDSLVSEAELHNYLENLQSSPEEEKRPILPEEMLPWLEPPGWELDTNDIVIYESQEWVTGFRKQQETSWGKYQALVERALSGDCEAANNPEEIEKMPGVKLVGNGKEYILYSRITTTDSPPKQVFFLIAPFNGQPSEEEIEETVKKIALSSLGEACIFSKEISLEELTPLARKSYPDYLLADEDCWFAIEKEEESNLALSAEEMRLLESVSSREADRSSLPIFINGRAGSGKSTMLLYLFADYCHRKYENGANKNFKGNPLFLTYNERLLDVAKKGVSKILSSHHQFLVKNEGEKNGESKSELNADNFFKAFQQFLLEMLPVEETNNFLPDNYVSFYRFQKEYKAKCNLPQAKKWNAEICWHAIRTFIKGYSSDGLMTPEDYVNIVSKKDRTISPEGFKEIYETIWQKWYQKLAEEENYWDDQDLIRKVIKGNYYRSDYGAVFCDEAQDFTKIELQLIMRLSLFSQYDLSQIPIISLPFAFAGDPLQTLNPTGFRWESVKAGFHDEIIKALDSKGQLNINMNLQELEFNYRSSSSIVGFINLIQLWRSVFFDLPELRAQKEWKKDDFPEPQKFIFSEKFHPDELKKHVIDTIIIVPCEEGGEKEYVENDEVLKEMFVNSENEEPLKNVLSAIAAKGLEFAKVILYKFGEECGKIWGSNIWNEARSSEERPVEFEYFFNKFYVAASRAKERLFIVDTMEGDRDFWSHASSEAEINKFLEKSQNADVWRGNVRAIALGKEPSEMRDDDPLAIAKELQDKGLNLRSPELMRRAKQYYNLASQTKEANLCEARALKFEDRLLEAGKAFMALQERDEARICFWHGMCWEDLEKWYEGYMDTAQVERALAQFMLEKEYNPTAIWNFTEFLENCVNDRRLGKPSVRQWREVVARYTSEISNQGESDFTHYQWGRLGTMLLELKAHGERTLECGGKCFFRAKNYQQAIECWKLCGATQTLEYFRARAENSGFPHNLEWLAKADDYQGVIEEWENAAKPKTIKKEFLEEVVWALREQKRSWDGLSLAIDLDDVALVKECFKEAMESESGLKEFGDLVKYLIKRNEWMEAITIVEESWPKMTASEQERTNLRCDIVKAIAYSELALEEMSLEERQGYAKMNFEERQEYDNKLFENRQRYDNLIKKVTAVSSLPKHINFKEIGSALERIGNYRNILEFYQPLCENRQEEKRNFARERWIATKRKQETYHRNKGELEKAEDIRWEIEDKSRRWGIDFNIQLLPYPDLSKEVLENLIRVKGLPNYIQLEPLKDGNIKFQVGDIEVQTKGKGDRRFLCFEDGNTGEDFRVILHDKRVSGSANYRESFETEHRLHFVVADSGYRGKVVFGEDSKHYIELHFQSLVGKVFINVDLGG
jgi:hypothetical protein